MRKRLTQQEIDERLIAWNESIEALRLWSTDQTPSQKKQAEIVIKKIDKLVDNWLNSITPTDSKEL